ncbi:helix-turn-helix domain-containing protein [Paenibacillus apiarius]|uniref:Helix-turn-helix domain-containing protein n=2 Tax=Paenibacillus apiarius TaxID=46240 RepID=A0ABT4DVW3_9BACL|nr:helix-turn-helix domain-containing protein [Paenibacillus apiarius]MCY9513158.1 helix-turn-helix domain-containing protein [Paenibacillus apiarius]MCY9521484.1 helix-turn-helix domain-containing protein [Paenibacillus apiarius]MCY9551639.1 helix-turn-helix domain-containing protein [Paenibacillus apiarius]MCY9560574.1 helix-turn-helix domain-containing protein [Paenibacillus apiarius]MCY9685176.1 helix-turn-helix domain-containing protein [Paenibacillus apiarius]
MKLLLSGEMNVTHTAGQVGYANLSHFSEAFRKKFGINPSELLRKR